MDTTATDAQSDKKYVKLIDGNIILVVGPEQNNRLRVSSLFLSVASPVFKAMFAPNKFLEGRNLDTSNPKEISLPDDDPEAIEVLCRFIHHRLESLPINTRKLVKFTKLVDKYQCALTMRSVATGWIDSILGGIKELGCHELCDLLAVCLFIDAPRDFHKVTSFFLRLWRREWDATVSQISSEVASIELYRAICKFTQDPTPASSTYSRDVRGDSEGSCQRDDQL
jgi:hypothetical protein